MSLEIMPLVLIAAVTGIVHTLLGPDHYVPFIALSKAQSWSRKKTAWITSACGMGHVLSAVAIGYAALGLRTSLSSLQVISSYRSDIAAWALIAFGCVYFIWGVKKLFKGKEEVSSLSSSRSNPIVWGLFIIFIIGHCEPLFVLMSPPLVANNALAILLTVGVFSVATILTMLTTVLAASFGLSFISGKRSMKFAPVISGILIMVCGAGIKFLGL